MTPPDDDPPPPKRRRKPPRGLEGFETGYPEDPFDPESSEVPRKAIWTESAPAPVSQPTASTPDESVTRGPSSVDEAWTPPTVVVDPTLQPSLSYAALDPASVVAEPTSIELMPSQAAAPSTGPTWIPSTATGPTTAPAAAAAAPASSTDLEPLPAAYAGTSDAELRDAVGAKPDKRAKPSNIYASGGSSGSDDTTSDFDGDKPRSRKLIVVSVVSLVVGLGIAALVFLGRANSASFYISCEPDRIIAQQGRSFPPWGEASLDGKQWAAIKIPPEAECIGLETESEDELSDQFRTALVKRAAALLTAKEVTKTDEANALLEQALLHTRSTSDASRNARVEIQRLLGDVAYWRASLKMRDASKALLDAAKQFDAAAQQRPRHVTDAAAWAEYVRKVVGQLEAGPAGVQPPFPPTPPIGAGSGDRPPAPPGVALPVEPDKGSASESPPAPPDAGIPTGGVLL